jgi:hypothetical protein
MARAKINAPAEETTRADPVSGSVQRGRNSKKINKKGLKPVVAVSRPRFGFQFAVRARLRCVARHATCSAVSHSRQTGWRF